MAESSERALSPDEAAYIAAARAKAFVLYEGVLTPQSGSEGTPIVRESA